MQIQRPILAAGLLLWPTLAHAEPGAPGGHWPIMWAVAIVIAIGLGSVPFWIERGRQEKAPRWKTWLMAVMLAAGFLIFFAPAAMAILSILITGRTM